jgi:hypothetical protein
MISNNQDT